MNSGPTGVPQERVRFVVRCASTPWIARKGPELYSRTLRCSSISIRHQGRIFRTQVFLLSYSRIADDAAR